MLPTSDRAARHGQVLKHSLSAASSMSTQLGIFLLAILIGLQKAFAAPSVGSCGTWQDAYTELHRDVLAAKRPPRYAVAVAVEAGKELGCHAPFYKGFDHCILTVELAAGLTDNIVGIITAFFYAVLSDRAFQMLTHSDLPDFRDAYDYPHIDLTRRPDQDTQHLTQPLHHTYTGSREYGPEVDASLHASAYLINANGENDKVFGSQDLRQWPSGGKAETVFLGSNRGRVIKLFSNPHHSQQLYDMGLRPDTIFACGFQYLFQPNKIVKSLFQHYMSELQASSAALRIGVNIRAGDGVFAGHTVGEDIATDYISCAVEVENTRKGANQSVVWSASSCQPHRHASIRPEQVQTGQRSYLTCPGF